LQYREHVLNEILQDHEVEVDDLKQELQEQIVRTQQRLSLSEFASNIVTI